MAPSIDFSSDEEESDYTVYQRRGSLEVIITGPKSEQKDRILSSEI